MEQTEREKSLWEQIHGLERHIAELEELLVNPKPVGNLDQPVYDAVDCGERVRNVLDHLGVKTLGDLLALSAAELQAQRNFGHQSWLYLRRTLAENGLRLRPNHAPKHEPKTDAIVALSERVARLELRLDSPWLGKDGAELIRRIDAARAERAIDKDTP